MSANIWTQKKVHIAKTGEMSRPMCGASANEKPETRTGHLSVPHGVTCERCIKLFQAKRKPTPWPTAAIREVESLRAQVAKMRSETKMTFSR